MCSDVSTSWESCAVQWLHSPERKLRSKACRSLPPTKLWFMDVQLRNYWTFSQWIEYRAVYFQDTYTLLYAFTCSVTLVGVSIPLTWLLWLWDIQLIQPEDILVLALMFLNFHLMKTWNFGDTGVISLISYRRIQWQCFILWKHRDQWQTRWYQDLICTSSVSSGILLKTTQQKSQWTKTRRNHSLCLNETHNLLAVFWVFYFFVPQ